MNLLLQWICLKQSSAFNGLYTAGSWYEEGMTDAGLQYGSIVNYASFTIKSLVMKLPFCPPRNQFNEDLNTVQTSKQIPLSSFPSMLTRRMASHKSLEQSQKLFYLLIILSSYYFIYYFTFIAKITYWIQGSQGKGAMASHFHNTWEMKTSTNSKAQH